MNHYEFVAVQTVTFRPWLSAHVQTCNLCVTHSVLLCKHHFALKLFVSVYAFRVL